MQQTEDILVFGKNKINYYPQMADRKKLVKSFEAKRTEIMGGKVMVIKKNIPMVSKNTIDIQTERGLHPPKNQ